MACWRPQPLTSGQCPVHGCQHGFLQGVTHEGPVVQLHEGVARGQSPVCLYRDAGHRGHLLPVPARRTRCLQSAGSGQSRPWGSGRRAGPHAPLITGRGAAVTVLGCHLGPCNICACFTTPPEITWLPEARAGPRVAVTHTESCWGDPWSGPRWEGLCQALTLKAWAGQLSVPSAQKRPRWAPGDPDAPCSPEPSHTAHHQAVTGQGPCLVEAAHLHLAGEGDPEGLRAVHVWVVGARVRGPAGPQPTRRPAPAPETHRAWPGR